MGEDISPCQQVSLGGGGGHRPIKGRMHLHFLSCARACVCVCVRVCVYVCMCVCVRLSTCLCV